MHALHPWQWQTSHATHVETMPLLWWRNKQYIHARWVEKETNTGNEREIRFSFWLYGFVSKSKAHTGLKLISRAKSLLNIKRSYVIFSIKSFAPPNFGWAQSGSVFFVFVWHFIEDMCICTYIDTQTANEKESEIKEQKIYISTKRMSMFSVRLWKTPPNSLAQYF